MRHSTSVSGEVLSRRVRVYKYGMLAPRACIDRILEEDRRMLSLWNALVEIGETSRKEWEGALSQDADLHRAEARMSELRARLDRARAHVRELREGEFRADELERARDSLQAARSEFTESIRVMRVARRSAREAMATQTRKMTEEREKRLSAALKTSLESGLHWSFAESVLDRWRTAWSQALLGKRGFAKSKDSTQDPLPYVFRYTHGGARLARLFSSRSRLVRLAVPDEEEPPTSLGPSAQRRWRRMRSRGRALITIGGHAFDFGIVYHRRLPAGSLLKRIDLARSRRFHRKSGAPPGWEWHLCITVEEPHVGPAVHPLPGTLAALAMGWRRVEGRVRVATIATPNSGSEDVWLPDKVSRRYEAAQRLQVRLSDELKAIKSKASSLVESRALVDTDFAALKDAWPRVRTGGLLRLLSRLGADRDEGNLAKEIERWDRSRLRLLNIRRSLIRHACRQRSWWWQNVLLTLCRKYSTIVTMDLDLESLKKRPAASTPASAHAHAASMAGQQLAGLHEARRWLELMAAKTGTRLRVQPAAYVSLRCSRCSRCAACSSLLDAVSLELHRCAGREAAETSATGYSCKACGYEADRIVNSASNLLAAAVGNGAPA